MTRAVPEVQAVVEKIERPEPPEPEGLVVLYRFPGSDNFWHASDPQDDGPATEYANHMASYKGCDVRLVRIGPEPAAKSTEGEGVVPPQIPMEERLRRQAVTIKQVRDEIERQNADNAALREQVKALREYVEHLDTNPHTTLFSSTKEHYEAWAKWQEKYKALRARIGPEPAVPPQTTPGEERIINPFVIGEMEERHAATRKFMAARIKRMSDALAAKDATIARQSSEIAAQAEQIAKLTVERDEAQREKYGTPCRCEAWIEACGKAEDERDQMAEQVKALRKLVECHEVEPLGYKNVRHPGWVLELRRRMREAGRTDDGTWTDPLPAAQEEKPWLQDTMDDARAQNAELPPQLRRTDIAPASPAPEEKP